MHRTLATMPVRRAPTPAHCGNFDRRCWNPRLSPQSDLRAPRCMMTEPAASTCCVVIHCLSTAHPHDWHAEHRWFSTWRHRTIARCRPG